MAEPVNESDPGDQLSVFERQPLYDILWDTRKRSIIEHPLTADCAKPMIVRVWRIDDSDDWGRRHADQ